MRNKKEINLPDAARFISWILLNSHNLVGNMPLFEPTKSYLVVANHHNMFDSLPIAGVLPPNSFAISDAFFYKVVQFFLPSVAEQMIPVSTKPSGKLIDQLINRTFTEADTPFDPAKIVDTVWNNSYQGGILLLFPGRHRGEDNGQWRLGVGRILHEAAKNKIPVEIIMAWSHDKRIEISAPEIAPNVSTPEEFVQKLRNRYGKHFPNAYAKP